MGGESYIYTDETELLINFLYSSDPDSVYYLIANDAVKQEVTVNGLPGEVFISPSEEETSTEMTSEEDTAEVTEEDTAETIEETTEEDTEEQTEEITSEENTEDSQEGSSEEE